MTAAGGTLAASAPRRVELAGNRFFEVHRRALAVAVVLLVVGLGLALVVERDPIHPPFQGIDDWWLDWSDDHRTGALIRGAELISALGGVAVLLPLRLAAVIVLAARQRWLQLAVFVSAVVSSEVLIGVLKSWTDRPRPTGALVETTGASFPSGHAIAGAVTALALVVAFVPARVERLRYIGAAAAFAALMAMSRAYLAAHWFSDVVAGTLLGVGVALFWPALLELVRERRVGSWTAATVAVDAPVSVGARVKRRRPTGERPPLPRPVPVHARRALVAAAGVVLVWVSTEVTFGQGSWARRFDRSLLSFAADHRRSWTVTIAKTVDTLTHVGVVHAALVLVLVALLCLRQVRRAVAFAVAVLGTEVIAAAVRQSMQRPRPYDVEIVGSWAGYASPSAPVAALTSLLFGACFAFAPPGIARRRAFGAAAAVVAAVAIGRVVLSTDYLSDMIAGAAIAAVVVIVCFLWIAPDSSFPIRYRGQRAHVELDQARTAAIRLAMREQLGMEIDTIHPLGNAGSAGSTPLRLDSRDGVRLFAKLLAERHVRADRQYKFVRAVFYGRLEDERPFSSVRRLAMNEDYLLRVFAAAGAPVVRSHGLVELTPQREYLVVTEFAESARELGDPDLDVTDGVIDEALQAVRRLWDAGLAHRDIKPSNVMVRDGHVLLIDVGFAELRPSPWRQAVDLANMLLCLALRTDAERVYRRSLSVFTPDDVAEAMAATCSITVPSQLHKAIAADGRDLIGEFRALAPVRPRITIQRWTARRVWLLTATLLGGVLGINLVWAVIFGHDTRDVAPPLCSSATELLVAQSVPSAAVVPCIRPDAAGLDIITAEVEDGRTMFTVITVEHGLVDVTVSAACDQATTSAVLRRDGVCVAMTGDVTAADAADLLDGRLALTPRSQLDDEVRRRTDGVIARLSPLPPHNGTD
jgi:membrane-associated phospholipid phosphatase